MKIATLASNCIGMGKAWMGCVFHDRWLWVLNTEGDFVEEHRFYPSQKTRPLGVVRNGSSADHGFFIDKE